MRNNAWLLKFGVILLVALCRMSAFGTTTPDNAIQFQWLVAGAFTASGENALFIDHLNGEALVRPKLGAPAGNNLGIQWQEAKPNEKGEFDFGKIWNTSKRSIVYAYTEISANE